MRHALQEPTGEDPRDLKLPNGCILCGGDLDVRVSDGEARSFCARCRWISRPHMQRHADGIHVVHPAGGLA
jgi:hypothetical protein